MIDQEPLAIPAVIETQGAPSFYAPAFAPQEEELEESRRTLSEYFWILKRHRWRILAFVGSMVVLSPAA